MNGRILVVEDEVMLAREICDILSEAGYEVLEYVRRGDDAVRVAQESSPDLVIMDIELEGDIDGIEAAHMIAEDWDAAIIYLTAHAESDLFKRAQKTHPYGYLGKPIAPNELLRAVEMSLSKHAVERELRESERRYQTLVEGMAEGVILQDADFIVRSYNPAAERILGIPADEVIGKSAFGIPCKCIREDGSPFSPEEHPSTLTLRTGEPFSNVLMGIPADTGEPRWISINTRPLVRESDTLPYATIVSFSDVTERRTAVEALKASEERSRRLYETARRQEEIYASLLHSTPDAVVVYDMEGRVEYLNSAHERMFGWPLEEVKGRPLPKLPDWDSEATFAIINDILHKGKVYRNYETQRLTASGRLLDVSVSAARYLDAQGRPAGMLVVERDISERKAAEQKLRDSEERFRTLSDATFEAIFLSDKGVCIGQNLSAERKFGYTEEEALGRNGTEWIAPDYRDLVLKNMMSEISESYEAVALRKDGSTFPCELQGRMLEYRGRRIRVTALRDITKQKAWEASLKESEAKYRNLFELSPDGIIVYSDRKAAMVNPSAAAILNARDPSEIVGRSVHEISHPWYHRLVEERIKRIIDEGRAAPLTEQVYIAADGQEVSVEAAAAPFTYDGRSAILSVFRDISDRKRAEQALRTSEEMLRTVLQGSPAGITLTRNRRLMWANDSFEKLFGFDSDEDYVGKSSQGLYLTDEEYDKVEALYEALKDGDAHQLDVLWRRKDGTPFEGRMMMKAIDPADPRAGAIASLVDIAELKRAEELAVSAERLKATAELSSGVAHNFNNLLQIVLGGSQLALTALELGNVTQAKESLEQIVESAKFGAQTVKRLQDFARFPMDRGPGKVFDVSNTVREAIEMSKPWWKTNPEKEGTTITLNRYLRRGCLVKGRESEIFEVVVNLLKNAAEALPEGGAIKVRTFTERGFVSIMVEDDGVGIADTDVGKLFEPFWTTKGPQGTGMGLAGSYGIVRRHGGEIAVQSRPGRGSVFTVRLPWATESHTDRENADRSKFDFALDILVVDDMSALTQQLEAGLTALGQNAVSALSGRQALEIFNEARVDAIVCDLAMPEMNGRQVAAAIRDLCRERGTPKPPFILLTGWGAQAGEEPNTQESGIDMVLQKPVDIRVLLESIASLVGREGASNPGKDNRSTD